MTTLKRENLLKEKVIMLKHLKSNVLKIPTLHYKGDVYVTKYDIYQKQVI
jgi:hypothetical protein